MANFCSTCGSSLNIGGNYCPKCGKSVSLLNTYGNYTPLINSSPKATENRKDCEYCDGTGQVTLSDSDVFPFQLLSFFTAGILSDVAGDVCECPKCHGRGYK